MAAKEKQSDDVTAPHAKAMLHENPEAGCAIVVLLGPERPYVTVSVTHPAMRLLAPGILRDIANQIERNPDGSNAYAHSRDPSKSTGKA